MDKLSNSNKDNFKSLKLGPYQVDKGQNQPFFKRKEICYFVSDEGDYLFCKNEKGFHITVAKPYLLRRSPFEDAIDPFLVFVKDGETVEATFEYPDDDIHNERIATIDDVEVEQSYTPYLINEIIHIKYMNTNINNVSYQSINTAGRTWGSKGGDSSLIAVVKSSYTTYRYSIKLYSQYDDNGDVHDDYLIDIGILIVPQAQIAVDEEIPDDTELIVKKTKYGDDTFYSPYQTVGLI